MHPHKALVQRYWQALDNTNSPDIRTGLSSCIGDAFTWHGHHPVGDTQGAGQFLDKAWLPLMSSFTDMSRETFLLFAGVSNGRIDGDIEADGKFWVTGTGLLHATFSKDYLGLRATGAKVSIRWGEFCRIENDRIAESYFLIDLLDVFDQLGLQVLPAPKGVPGIYPPPAANDGILDADHYPGSEYSLEHIRRFIFDALNAYDANALESMGMADYFHPQVKWYGPGGIGACLDFEAFEKKHQQPWLIAFPDRRVQDLDALIAEGAYSGAPGWAGVIGTHSGPYQDCPATGKTIEFNGLDWWKRDAGQYIENWVFVDMLHLFDQFGVNLLERAIRAQSTG